MYCRMIRSRVICRSYIMRISMRNNSLYCIVICGRVICRSGDSTCNGSMYCRIIRSRVIRRSGDSTRNICHHHLNYKVVQDIRISTLGDSMYGKYAYIMYKMYRYHNGVTRNMRTYSMYRYHDGVIPRSGDSTRTDIHSIYIYIYMCTRFEKTSI